MNKHHLLVLEEIKKDPLFYNSKHLIRYEIPKSNEQITDQLRIDKVTAVWDLRDMGAFDTDHYDRIGLDFIFYLKINYEEFEKIYEKCKLEVTKQVIIDDNQIILTSEQKKKLNHKVKELIAVHNMPKKRAKLLMCLSDFKLKEGAWLQREIPTKNLPSLKRDTMNQIRNTGFTINYIRGSFQKTFYQLRYFAPI